MINNAFWKHSTKRYAQPAIAQICLQWQNDIRANTNLILLADWLGSQCIVLSAEQWNNINEFILPWHNDVVLPLRKVRTILKSKISNKHIYQLRDNIKEQELAAEQILQANLYDYCQKNIAINPEPNVCPTAKESIKENIETYLTICCGVKQIEEVQIAVFL